VPRRGKRGGKLTEDEREIRNAEYEGPPRGGCENCGNAVRTYKPGYGWLCAECVREAKKHEPLVNQVIRDYPRIVIHLAHRQLKGTK
jgi:hypothetical protein